MPDILIPTTRPVTGPAKWLAISSRWMRRNLTQENLIQTLKTIASVGPLTVLIWIYAERSGVRTEPDVSISIEVRCSDPHRFVSLEKPYPDKSVVATLEGPPNILDNVVQQLERHSGDEPAVEIFIDPTLEPGRVHEIDAKSNLAKNPVFSGISITSCQPAYLDVRVDELQERDLEVQAPKGITNLVGPPLFTPRTVKVRGPAATLQDFFNAHTLVAEADLAGLDGMNVPGPHDFPIVRVKPLDNPNLTFSPPSVEAAVSVRESDVTGVVLSVPIWVSSPPDMMGTYRVQFSNPANGVLKNVKVTGPADKIAMVNQLEFSPKPLALLKISHDDDEAGKPLQRQVTFEQLLGLHVDDETSQHPVEFSLEKVKTGNE